VASIIRLEQGLYALEIAGTTGPAGQIPGAALPVIQVSAPPGEQTDRVEIIGASGDAGSRIGRDGGCWTSLRARPVCQRVEVSSESQVRS
jgi:hypothetical protein